MTGTNCYQCGIGLNVTYWDRRLDETRKSGNIDVRDKINIALIPSLVSILFLISNGNAAFAVSGSEQSDSFYVMKFEKFTDAFEKHIQQLDKCIAEMELFEKEGKSLVFKDVECSKFNEMRTEAQDLYAEVRAVLEEYYGWINSLTENTFRELVKDSNSSQSILLTSARTYLTKQKQVLVQSERVMQKQVQRISEMEQRIKEAEQQFESSQGDEGSQVPGKSN